jgi:hypothetical protein
MQQRPELCLQTSENSKNGDITKQKTSTSLFNAMNASTIPQICKKNRGSVMVLVALAGDRES